MSALGSWSPFATFVTECGCSEHSLPIFNRHEHSLHASMKINELLQIWQWSRRLMKTLLIIAITDGGLPTWCMCADLRGGRGVRLG